jgi:hypothetical protein
MKNKIAKVCAFVLFLVLQFSCSCDFSTLKIGDISVLSPLRNKILTGDDIELNIVVDNPKNCPVDYIWESPGGKIEPRKGMSNVRFKVPCETGTVRVICKIVNKNDTSDVVDSKYMDLNVQRLDPVDILSKFVPSGWMEVDNSNLSFDQTMYRGRSCNGIIFTPSATKNRWGGIYWLNGGNYETASRVDLTGYHKITFRACSQGNAKVDFGAGTKDKDTFYCNTGVVTLEENWKQYSIDLNGKDLSKILGGFFWVASAAYNPGTIYFFLADIRYESGNCN